MAPTDAASDHPGTEDKIKAPLRITPSRVTGTERSDSSKDGHPFGDGHRPGIPREELADDALEAFSSGNPATVFSAVKKLAEAYQELCVETSRLRFRVNFGTPICMSCNGLKAGPGVLATCFQIQRCNYDHILDGDASQKHLRILKSLEVDPKNRP